MHVLHEMCLKKRHFLDLMAVAMLRSHDQPNTTITKYNHADWMTAVSASEQ